MENLEKLETMRSYLVNIATQKVNIRGREEKTCDLTKIARISYENSQTSLKFSHLAMYNYLI